MVRVELDSNLSNLTIKTVLVISKTDEIRLNYKIMWNDVSSI